jgi:hypothetical protein
MSPAADRLRVRASIPYSLGVLSTAAGWDNLPRMVQRKAQSLQGRGRRRGIQAAMPTGLAAYRKSKNIGNRMRAHDPMIATMMNRRVWAGDAFPS